MEVEDRGGRGRRGVVWTDERGRKREQEWFVGNSDLKGHQIQIKPVHPGTGLCLGGSLSGLVRFVP